MTRSSARRAQGRGRLKLVAWYAGPLLAYAGAIFYLSSLSHPPLPRLAFPHADKLLHAVEYAGLGLLLCRALHAGGRGMRLRLASSLAVVLSALYAVSDEVHQAFVPGRSPEALDALVDFVGSAAGAGVFVALARRRALKRKARESRSAALPVPGATRAQE